MSKSYVAISAIIFALVAIGHLLRLAQGWDVQIGGMGIAMSVSWIALVVSAALAVWGALVLRRRLRKNDDV
jgi:hypothetical protein